MMTKEATTMLIRFQAVTLKRLTIVKSSQARIVMMMRFSFLSSEGTKLVDDGDEQRTGNDDLGGEVLRRKRIQGEH